MTLLLLALLAAAPAPPGSPPVAVVAVGTDAAGKAAAPQLQSLGGAAVARSRFQAVDLVESLDPERAAERARSRQSAEAALAEAEKLYNDLDTRGAAQKADAAARFFQESDLTQAWPSYVRARVLKIACTVANGQSKPARAELERLLAIAPDAELPPAQFAPDLLAFARRTRKAVQARDARLEVKSTPEGAEVWVDGKRRGVAPLAVRGLGAGDHHLALRAPGFSLFQQLASGTTVAALVPASRQSLWAAMERSASDRAAVMKAAAALGSGAGAAQVLLVLASRGDRPDSVALEVIRMDAEGARVRATARGSVPLDGLGAGASILLDRALGPDQPPQVVQLVPKELPPSAAPAPLAAVPGSPADPFTWTQTHTGAALMAGGAALAGAGGFFGYQAMVKRDQLRATPQTDPASQQLIARGQLYALVADALFVSALAAGAAGGYLAFLAPAQGPKPEAR